MSLTEYGKEYHEKLSSYGKYSSIFEAVKYTKRWYYGWLQYIGRRYLNLDGKGKKVLDVGCGTGAMLALLSERGFQCYGMDLSSFITPQNHQAINSLVVIGNAEEGIPFKGLFDLIICFEVLEHFRKPDHALRHMIASLKVGGILCASTPYPQGSACLDPTHISLKKPKEWVHLLKQTGFSDIQYQPIRAIPFIWKFGKTFSKVVSVPDQLSNTVLLICRR